MLAASRPSTTSPINFASAETALECPHVGKHDRGDDGWNCCEQKERRHGSDLLAGRREPSERRRARSLRPGIRRGRGLGKGPGRWEGPAMVAASRSRGGRVGSPVILTKRTNPMAATTPTAFQYVRGWLEATHRRHVVGERANTRGKDASDKPLADDDQSSER